MFGGHECHRQREFVVYYIIMCILRCLLAAVVCLRRPSATINVRVTHLTAAPANAAAVAAVHGSLLE